METAFVLYSKPSSASYLKTSPWREILALFTADRISVFIFGFKAAGNCIKEMLHAGHSHLIRPWNCWLVKQLFLAILAHLPMASFLLAFAEY